MSEALIIIDVQNDFCKDGALEVPDADRIIPMINELAIDYKHVILTQDWHPENHSSFACEQDGMSPFMEMQFPYGMQTMWPVHCVQDSYGADFPRELDIPYAELILRKGFRKDIDSYSAFQENDLITKTGLAGYLRERDITKLTMCGLATDFCVGFSAVDGRTFGFEVDVLIHACRAINLNGSLDRMMREMMHVGVKILY